MEHETDAVIVGAGPVGLFAVFELGMLRIRAHVVDSLEAIGGQCTALYPEKPIYDIPGFPRVDAGDLVARLEEQAAPFSPVYHLDQRVEALTPLEGGWRVETSKGAAIRCKAVLIAAGAGAFGPNRPPLEGLAAYEGRSVFYAVRRPRGIPRQAGGDRRRRRQRGGLGLVARGSRGVGCGRASPPPNSAPRRRASRA